MLKIRLQRIGRKNDPSFRAVVVDSRQGPRAGRYIDLVGTYNPKLGAVSLNGEKIKEWIKNGAQVSPTLHNMLITAGIISGKKINVLPRKTPIVAEKPAEEAAPAASETPVEAAPEAPTEVAEEPKKEEAETPAAA